MRRLSLINATVWSVFPVPVYAQIKYVVVKTPIAKAAHCPNKKALAQFGQLIGLLHRLHWMSYILKVYIQLLRYICQFCYFIYHNNTDVCL